MNLLSCPDILCLTAFDPRLSTGCLPGFTGLGVSPDDTVYTEPAHVQMNYTISSSQVQSFSLLGRKSSPGEALISAKKGKGPVLISTEP